jgi:hypothetical protein
MRFTVERLLAGDERIPNYYQLARKVWEEFYREHENEGVEDWANWISAAQTSEFEEHFGGRLLGQEVMAWSAIAYHYTTGAGFTDRGRANATKVMKAFAKSTVSIEVKSQVREAALSYNLDEELKAALSWL